MKYLIASAALFASLSTAAGAQTVTGPAPAAAAVAAFSIDSPIEQLVANPATKAVLEADFPGVTTHPAYEQFKAMSLKQLAPYSNGIITDEMLAKASADLAAVK
ncbi:hypothetical protein [Aquisediminimonas profunda]|uniref:hypothetical protein n=1 Tax=Aquisediminimonas profunda TaxID=1550733 RepID=UPI001C63B20C|nr:hypothetical protein [Aquisediminimonas profunda]